MQPMILEEIMHGKSHYFSHIPYQPNETIQNNKQNKTYPGITAI